MIIMLLLLFTASENKQCCDAVKKSEPESYIRYSTNKHLKRLNILYSSMFFEEVKF